MPNILQPVLNVLRPILPARFRADIPVVPVVRLSGVIGVVTPLRPGLMLSTVARSLERAFSVRNARAVALVINSPGGSPSQSHLIFRRIRQLSEEKEIPVLAFIEDVGASGGYMLACSADEIVCDQYSIVGSIGVVGGGFGFPKAMEKLGIERRLYTSGDRKVTLDPFQPEKPEDVKRLKALQKDIHEHFIALVKTRRGAHLKGADKTLFSGEFWTADRAIELGPGRPPRRPAFDAARALRRQGAHAADFGRAQPVRPPAARRGACRCLGRPPRPCRRFRLGAGNARIVVALWPVITRTWPRFRRAGPAPNLPRFGG